MIVRLVYDLPDDRDAFVGNVVSLLERSEPAWEVASATADDAANGDTSGYMLARHQMAMGTGQGHG